MNLFNVVVSALVVIDGAAAFTSWSWTFDFGTRSEKLPRRLYMDFRLGSTFLIRPEAAKRDDDTTYDPKLFPNYQATEEIFSRAFDGYRNGKASYGQGYYGSDLVARVADHENPPLRKSFGLVDKIEGSDPTMDSHGYPFAGRLAMAKTINSSEESFQDALFAGVSNRLLCGASICRSKQGVLMCSTSLTVGVFPDNKITTATTLPDDWVILTDGWMLGKAKNLLPGRMEFCPTSRDIIVPNPYIASIIDSIGNVEQREDGNFYVPCSKRKTDKPFFLFVAGATLSIKPTEYIDALTCRLRIRAAPMDSQILIVGTPLTESVGTCLDFNTGAVTFFNSVGLQHSLQDSGSDFSVHRPNNFTQQMVSLRKLM